MFWYIARILFPTVHAPIFSSLVSYFLIFMSNYAAGYPVNRSCLTENAIEKHTLTNAHINRFGPPLL